MNESKNGALLYETVPAVAGLNKVPGFDPRKLLRREKSKATEEEVLKLDLRYKKLWFRLAHPEGRIHLNALRITEQLAVIEAQVYLNRSDPKPVSSFTSQRSIADTPSGLYVQEAEHEAMNEALDSAGFGLQFCDVSQPGGERFGTEITLHRQQAPAPAEMPQEDVHEKQTAPPVSGPVQPAEAVREAPLPNAMAAPPPPADEQPPARQIAAEVPAPQESGAVSAPGRTVAAVRENVAMEPMQAQNAAQTPSRQVTGDMGPTPQSAATVVKEEPANMETPAPPPAPAAEAVQSDAADLHIAADPARTEEPPIMGTAPVQTAGASYTPDMPVEEICDLMTLEEAQGLVVGVGICNGWTMAQVAERRAASLKWYLYSDQIKDNTVKAAAKKMLEHLAGQQKAS